MTFLISLIVILMFLSVSSIPPNISSTFSSKSLSTSESNVVAASGCSNSILSNSFSVNLSKSNSMTSSTSSFPPTICMYIQMVGGNDDVEDVIELDFDKFTENEFDNMELEQPDAATTFDSEVERDLEENVEEIFGGIEETDKNIKMTIKEIKNVITSDSYNKINESINEFDTSKDNNMFGESLRDIFEKTYITQQYIYKDDTIKMIRQKISSSIKNNTKFGDKAYIIPSYQYMWSEYILNDKIE